ncbi:glycoside hydrolase family 76 protein [Pseudocercospora fijiensis CIRAD86]|uniref:Mannan endo-1,6-alpha-mannosidase n=1 Tax=Pseudocercospora fijiensis (strain CIRAD86) TaxID=383855 RepID=M3B0S8_PSEFD|nr:glycoside hydrolase family 76 protein [Pseudocercospora fijiensis CIRAD86]EME83008.1 glycoside hydrolase family 76 protein [Pseudocercospora fijiensis CIRAD86]
MRVSSAIAGLLGLVASAGIAYAQSARDASQVYSPENVRNSTRPLVDSILRIYHGNRTTPLPGFIPGLFPKPYYWWESGLAFDSLINYWAYTEDETIVDLVRQAMVFQVGPDLNYMPPNQSKSLGNDDQSTWALAAMTAAEFGFPEPVSINATWAQLAANVFDSQVARWDEESCGGGLKWQIFTFNAGYNYKNSLTQANFAQLGARLSKYTANSTYLDWAQRAIEWSFNIGLVDADRSGIYDGTDDTTNCSEVNHIQWTINAGQFLDAYAYACNESSSCTRWFNSIGAVALAELPVFTDDDVLYEVACAPNNNCNVDQLAFRAPLARALGNVRDMVNTTVVTLNGTSSSSTNKTDYISTIIDRSAQGALRQCAAATNNSQTAVRCGSDWSSTEWDGTQGLGQVLSALEIMLAGIPRKRLNTMNSTVNGNGTSTSGNGSGTGTGGGSATSSPAAPNEAGSVVSASFVATLMTVCFGAVFFALV